MVKSGNATRWRKCRMFVALALVAIPTSAQAQRETGDALLAACESGARAEEPCIAYVAAVADVMRNGNPLYGWYACPPDGTQAREIYATAMRFRRQRGDVRHYSASAVVAHAMASAYPCPRR